jgi:hypothetical protein
MRMTNNTAGSAYHFHGGIYLARVLKNRARFILLCFLTLLCSFAYSTPEAKAQTTYYIAGTNTNAISASDAYNGLYPSYTSGANGPWATFANVNHGGT